MCKNVGFQEKIVIKYNNIYAWIFAEIPHHYHQTKFFFEKKRHRIVVKYVIKICINMKVFPIYKYVIKPYMYLCVYLCMYIWEHFKFYVYYILIYLNNHCIILLIQKQEVKSMEGNRCMYLFTIKIPTTFQTALAIEYFV